MRSIDEKFYHSKAWKLTRKSVWIRQHCLCNRCHKPVYVDGVSDYIEPKYRTKGIVHHKEYLNETNVMDDEIAFGLDNLEGLCIDCHNKEHFSSQVTRSGFSFDEDGQLVGE